MNISIRAETPGDIDAIARLTEAAFRNETHSSHTEQYIIDALRRAGALTFSLVAEANGQVIGHIAASPVTIDGEAGDWYGLAPLSVAPERQHQASVRSWSGACSPSCACCPRAAAWYWANRPTTRTSAFGWKAAWRCPAFPPNTSRHSPSAGAWRKE